MNDLVQTPVCSIYKEPIILSALQMVKEKLEFEFVDILGVQRKTAHDQ